MSELSSPTWIEPREYQTRAVLAWMNANGQGIFNMATGTGKTITSLLAASELASLQNDRLALIVAAPYQHLVDQWTREITEFGLTPFRAYQSKSQWLGSVTGAITEFSHGSRDTLAIVTTHKTFASKYFRQLLDRLDGTQTLLIADEVHHMGAPHLQKAFIPHIRTRLGLSATPNRWYDDEGTDAIYEYFTNGVVFEYGLGEAISNRHLSEYYYVPHVIHLTDDEAEEYLAVSKAIGRRLADVGGKIADADFQEDETLKQLLFKRSRLIGTAENKFHILQKLLTQIGPDKIHHSLIYCGDGQVETDGEEIKRQLRAVTELLGTELGIRTHQFTYEENQKTRENLLADFKSGELQAMVAIRCLDEGVDVPATQTAFILASSTNPRQFIQRRGRILRTHDSKDYSVIHDFIVAPPSAIHTHGKEDSVFNIERRLIGKELQRVSTFAEHAKNHPDGELRRIPTSNKSITSLKKDYNLMDL